MKFLTKTVLAAFVAVLFFNVSANAQTENKGFVIVSSSTSYTASLKKAKKAAKKLGYKLDLRLLKPNNKSGLTMAKEICDEAGFDFPVYSPRGRYDDGKYVSIEYTNGYQGFTEGYYIVVICSAVKGNAELKEALKLAKKKRFKKAKIKYADIYMGCSH